MSVISYNIECIFIVILINCLILIQKLNVHHNFESKKELVRWGKHMIHNIEINIRSRGRSDLVEYINIKEEMKHNIEIYR